MLGALLLSLSLFAKVNTYWVGGHKTPDALLLDLKGKGFEVLAQYPVSGSSKHTVTIVTNEDLKKLGNKEGRGFASVIRFISNAEKGETRVQNPNYFLPAFLQKDNDVAVAEKLTALVKESITNPVASKDALFEKDLPDYHFMMGMPYYDDTLTVGKGDSAQLVKKAEERAGKSLLFKLPLGENRYLLGFNLEDVEKFSSVIGMDNSVILPWTVLIEDGTAKALHGKYYIAISYPLLTMTEFMKIMSTPSEIEDKLESYLK